MPNINNRELNPLSDYSQEQTMANVSSGRGKRGSDESMEIMTFAMNTRREKNSTKKHSVNINKSSNEDDGYHNEDEEDSNSDSSFYDEDIGSDIK